MEDYKSIGSRKEMSKFNKYLKLVYKDMLNQINLSLLTFECHEGLTRR